MAAATHMTVRLVRFDGMRELPGAEGSLVGDPLRTIVGSDGRAVGSPPGSATASVWAILGLFDDEASARADFEAGDAGVDWAGDATESWIGLCRPFSHRGEVDHLGNAEPGSTYTADDMPAPDGPFAVMTTVGWDFAAPDFDVARAMDFAAGVAAVRTAMAEVDGLHSQQAFTAEGFAADGFTFTFWRDDAAMRSFAYRPGVHKDQMDHYKQVHNADRTSFTRLRVLDRAGTWHGTDPLSWDEIL